MGFASLYPSYSLSPLQDGQNPSFILKPVIPAVDNISDNRNQDNWTPSSTRVFLPNRKQKNRQAMQQTNINIRSRFLVAIVSIALVVLLLFGSIAYHIADDASEHKEVAILQVDVEHAAQVLSQQHNTEDYLSFLHQLYTYHAYLFVLRNPDGEIIPSKLTILPSHIDVSHLLAEIGPPATSVRNGVISINEQRYPWASAPLTDNNLELLMIHRPEIAVTSIFETIAARLIIAGIIIIWIAVWAALILTSVISRRIHAHNAELQHRASHDDLTQLPNRSLLHQRTEKALATASLQNQKLALLVMDLDRFKEINDTLGHHVGDELLMQVSRRISSVLRDSDTVARLGGDEFSLLLPNANVENAIACVERISQALNKPFHISDQEITASFSIGIAMFPQHGDDMESLLKYADIAMYQAKQNGAGYSVYDAEHDSYTLQRLNLARELRAAIEENQLILYYQPKIDIPTAKINGVEALVRWQHPQHGIIPPDEFISIAEQNGLIDSLTYWVIEAAIKQCHIWRESGMHMKVAINLSARNLHNTSLPDWIEGKLRQHSLAADTLELELTENAIMVDISCATHILNQLSKLGIPLSIDDFGTGMSSLSYLSRLPVSKLKIDRSFVMNMTDDENNHLIVRSTIDLAHNLGYQVVAEGVETIEALNLLKQLSCDCAQGYFFTPPLPAEKLETWLKDNGWEILSTPTTSIYSQTDKPGTKLNFN